MKIVINCYFVFLLEQLDDVAVEFQAPSRGSEGSKKSGNDKKGFTIAGAPWQMPDTNDTEQFPSMAGGPGADGVSGGEGGNGTGGPWNARSGRN